MNTFFKKEEKKPYTYSSIEMRKSSRNYVFWIAGAVISLIVIAIILL